MSDDDSDGEQVDGGGRRQGGSDWKRLKHGIQTGGSSKRKSKRGGGRGGSSRSSRERNSEQLRVFQRSHEWRGMCGDLDLRNGVAGELVHDDPADALVRTENKSP